MLDSATAAVAGTAVGSAALGIWGIINASDMQSLGLSIVACVGGILSVSMTAYASFRKINREFGVDEIKLANLKLKEMQEQSIQQNEQSAKQNDLIAKQSAELVELMKIQNKMFMYLNIQTSTVAEKTSVSADCALQQAATAAEIPIKP